MPNKHKGEVGLTLDGKDYVFKLTFNKLVELEDLGIDMLKGFESSAANIRVLFHVLASGQHGVESLEDAGDLIDEIGFTEASNLVGEVIAAFFQSSEEKKEEKSQ